MKILSVVLKIFIVLATFAYSASALFVGYILFSPTGLFSAPNTATEQFAGKIIVACGLIMVITALFVFRKKSTRYFVILLVSSLVEYLAFVSVEGFGSEADTFFVIYITLLLVLYGGISLIEKRISKNR